MIKLIGMGIQNTLKGLGKGKKRSILISNLVLEVLETRDLLSNTNTLVSSIINLPLQITPTTQNITPLAGNGFAAVYTPAQIRATYGFGNQSNTGAGQTIAIIDAYDDPNLVNDLAHFDQNFGLPGQSALAVNSFLTKVNEYGQAGPLPSANANWAYETALDVEWAHTIAPQAHILLVEAASASGYDLLTAVDSARNTTGVSVISMSWGSSEFNGETYYDSYFTTPVGHLTGNNQPGGITFVASAGDSGAWYGPEWPSVSPNVLAVGGTTLLPNGSQSAWSGGGGGYSLYESRPAYQVGFNPIPVRSTPDVSYSANPAYGYYVYDSYSLPAGYSGWWSIGGTSAGAPQWAGLIALANQARATNGLPSLTNAQSPLYTQTPASGFNDITTGSNGYAATAGYDVATGRGTPYANRIINALAAPAAPTTLAIKKGKNSPVIGQTIIAVGITSVGSPGSGLLEQANSNSSQNLFWYLQGQNTDSLPLASSPNPTVPQSHWFGSVDSGTVPNLAHKVAGIGDIPNSDEEKDPDDLFGFEIAGAEAQ